MFRGPRTPEAWRQLFSEVVRVEDGASPRPRPRTPSRHAEARPEVGSIPNFAIVSFTHGGLTALMRKFRGISTAHHDALEFPDGQIVLLTLLKEGQRATVLQLPATLERVKAAQPDKAKASEGQST